MAKNNRWLLPEGVEEILPRQAWQIDNFRRKTLDLYRSWGYELVIPPLIEYSESLLIGMGSDIDLQTFKLTDQLSGRTLAIRADITPQTARIDAHSWQQEGPTRLCYAGTVVHTKPKTQLSSRLPIEVGAELYGEQSLEGDKEVISLMLASLAAAGVQRVHLDLGHIGIYRGLVEAANLDIEASQAISDALERKASSEVRSLVEQYVKDAELAQMLNALVELNGDMSVLQQARSVLAKAPEHVQQALNDLTALADWVAKRFPQTPVVLDLAELRGYQYHTGLVFAAYIAGVGHSVANGGRFDGIGKAYGRARPATGFSVNVNALIPLISQQATEGLIIAPRMDDATLDQAIADLRVQGRRVVQQLPSAGIPGNCQQQLVSENGLWVVRPL